jgi:hypothetical protein
MQTGDIRRRVLQGENKLWYRDPVTDAFMAVAVTWTPDHVREALIPAQERIRVDAIYPRDFYVMDFLYRNPCERLNADGEWVPCQADGTEDWADA